MVRFLIILLLIVAGWWCFFYEPIDKHPPGVLVNEDPSLTPPPNTLTPWQKDNYTITPLDTYHIKARVLSKEHYIAGRETELSSYDLALGWREMSDTSVLNTINVSQGGRWYYVKWDPTRILMDPSKIEYESGNMHIVADNKKVLATIKKIEVGNVIIIDGYLVEIRAPDGWDWRSSLVLSSFGPHGCKVIWVKNVEIVQ